MTGQSVLVVTAGLASVMALLLAAPVRPRQSRRPAARLSSIPPDGQVGWLRQHRWLLCVLAGAGTATQTGGLLAPFLTAAVIVGMWVAIARLELPGVRAEREAARRDLAPLIELLAAGLTAGSPPGQALDIACLALPGAAADRLRVVRAQLALGADPERAWSEATNDSVLAPLARSMARAQRTGAPIADTISRLAADLAEQARARVEERARAVGVKAAVPLGLCLLPAFLLIGIVPVAASLLTSLI